MNVTYYSSPLELPANFQEVQTKQRAATKKVAEKLSEPWQSHGVKQTSSGSTNEEGPRMLLALNGTLFVGEDQS